MTYTKFFVLTLLFSFGLGSFSSFASNSEGEPRKKKMKKFHAGSSEMDPTDRTSKHSMHQQSGLNCPNSYPDSAEDADDERTDSEFEDDKSNNEDIRPRLSHQARNRTERGTPRTPNTISERSEDSDSDSTQKTQAYSSDETNTHSDSNYETPHSEEDERTPILLVSYTNDPMTCEEVATRLTHAKLRIILQNLVNDDSEDIFQKDLLTLLKGDESINGEDLIRLIYREDQFHGGFSALNTIERLNDIFEDEKLVNTNFSHVAAVNEFERAIVTFLNAQIHAE